MINWFVLFLSRYSWFSRILLNKSKLQKLQKQIFGLSRPIDGDKENLIQDYG